MKYPIRYGKDGMESLTVRDIVVMVADAMDDGNEEKALHLLDEHFIYGAWGHHLREPDGDYNPNDIIRVTPEENIIKNRDIRGMVLCAYREGFKRGSGKKDCSEKPCDHDWVDARNEVIVSGEICSKCHTMRPGNAT